MFWGWEDGGLRGYIPRMSRHDFKKVHSYGLPLLQQRSDVWCPFPCTSTRKHCIPGAWVGFRPGFLAMLQAPPDVLVVWNRPAVGVA